jgi:hypothetical protein
VSKRWQAAVTAKDGDEDGDEDSTAGKSPDRALGSLRKDYFACKTAWRGRMMTKS